MKSDTWEIGKAFIKFYAMCLLNAVMIVFGYYWITHDKYLLAILSIATAIANVIVIVQSMLCRILIVR